MLVPKVETKKNEDRDILKIEVDENITFEFIDNYNGINEDENKKDKYFKYIEKLVRNSIEYRDYIYTLKNEFDMTTCKIFKNIDIFKNDVSLEFHHYPFTLYDIVNIVYHTILENGYSKGIYYEDYSIYSDITKNPYKLADIITKLHYENKIGLVPLVKTAHELVHNGVIFIPLTSEYVFGSYKTFMKEYNYKIDNYDEKIKDLTDLTNKYLCGEKNIIDPNSKLKLLEIDIVMKESLKPQKISISSVANLA